MHPGVFIGSLLNPASVHYIALPINQLCISLPVGSQCWWLRGPGWAGSFAEKVAQGTWPVLLLRAPGAAGS